MAIRKPTRPMNLDYWQLTSQIQQTLAETGGAAPQSPTTQQPITITTTNVKTGDVKRQTIPAGTSIESIKREAQKRLAAQEDERIDVEVDGEEIKPTGITLSLSDRERQQLLTKQAEATCEGDRKKFEPRVYKATLEGGGYVLVEANNKKVAKKRATSAGYDVQRITWSPKYEIPTAKPTAVMDSFKDSKGSYDLIGIADALRTGEITDREVSDIFSSKGCLEVARVRDILTKLEPYKTGDGYLLSAALADRAISTYEAGKVFSQSVVDNAVSNRAAAATLSRYKDTNGNYDLVAISEALQTGRIKEGTIDSVLGRDATQAARDVGEIIKKLKPYKSGDDYFLTDALKDGAITEAEARQLFSDESISQSKGMMVISEAFTKQAAKGEVTGTVSGKYTAPATPTPRKAFPFKEAGLIAAEIVVPYVYVARHWNELPVWERALWITLDTALFIIPMAGAGVRGARSVAVAAAEAGRLARVSAALKNVGREAWIMVKAPVEAIIHPVAATRQAARDTRALIENIVRGKKIPEAVLTTTEGTVRLSITKATSVDEFMRARDALVKAAAQGETPLIALRDKSGKAIATLQLAEAPLMRELKGGIVHTTPWGERFRAGLTIEARANMPLAEQGLFVSHEPMPKFAKQSAFNLPVEIGQEVRGGQTITTRFAYNQVARIHLQKQLTQETISTLANAKIIQTGDNLIQPLSSKNMNKLVQALRESGNAKVAEVFQDTVASYKPIFRIMDPDKAKEIIASGKTYRGTVEIEARLPVGTKIEPPKQILVTRIGPESTEVQLWLDKPLSARQIAKLKAEGFLEIFRQPFRFPIKIKGKLGTLTPAQVDNLTRTIRGTGNPEVARNLERAYQLTQSARRMAEIAARAAAIIITRAPERLAAITRAEGVELVRSPEWLERNERLQRLERTKGGRTIRKPPRTERAERVERAKRIERTTRLERAERVTRVERPSRVERPTRGERPQRPIRGERPIRPIRPERPARPVRPIRPTKPTKLFRMEPPKSKKQFKREGPALAVWKQGRYWISVFPPFRTTGRKEDVVYSLRKPPWGSVIAKGRHAPKKTLRAMGRIPEVITVPMGITTATIRNGRTLTFSRSNGRRRGRVIE